MQRVRGKNERRFALGPGSSSKWLEGRVKGSRGTEEPQTMQGVVRMRRTSMVRAMAAFKVGRMGMA